MADKTIWDGIRELVRRQDLVAAVEALESWLKGRLDGPKESQVRDWLNELILHVSSVRAVQIDARKRLITKEAEGIELRQITNSILGLIDEIEGEDLSTSATPPAALPVPPEYQEGKFEKLFGNRNNLQMVSWLEIGLKRSTGVCRLVCGRDRGTGFRVQHDLLITNNHVIDSAAAAKRFSAQFFFEETIDGKIKNVIAVEIDPTRFWTSNQLDITIVGARFSSSTAEATIEPLPIELATEAAVGDPVSIIQHPLGGPKQIALTANEVINVYDHRIQYLTDTLPGSSGAPVFNSDWNVIAVHHAGGQLLKNAAGDHVFANEGISVASIRQVPEARRLLEAT